jgi:thiol-disulfide isomerase/thioredoxin
MEQPITQQQYISGKKFFIVFLITLGIFAIAFLASNYFYSLRSAAIKNVEAGINRQIIETEIQFQLLADAACDETNAGYMQITQMNELARRLDEMERQRGTRDIEVIALKKDYSLLMIKDYLLIRERQRRCGDDQNTIIYFYSNSGECSDCIKMGHVLTEMREEYDRLHIYAFDYNLGLSTLETLKSIYGTRAEPPILIINRKAYYGFKTRDEVEKLVPNIARLKTPSTSATTTTSTTTEKKK